MADLTCQHCGKPVRIANAKFCPSCGQALGGRDDATPALVEGAHEEISVALDEVMPAKCGLFVGLVAVRESTGARIGRVAHLTLAKPPAAVATVSLLLGDHAVYRFDGEPRYRVMLVGVYSDYVRLRVMPLVTPPQA